MPEIKITLVLNQVLTKSVLAQIKTENPIFKIAIVLIHILVAGTDF